LENSKAGSESHYRSDQLFPGASQPLVNDGGRSALFLPARSWKILF
jgi:hypothetical protein